MTTHGGTKGAAVRVFMSLYVLYLMSMFYRSTNAAQTRGEMVTPAAQWLLDNNYLVEDTIFQIKRDLPRRFYRELPTMTLPDGITVPRALALAWIYVAHSDSTVAGHTFIISHWQSGLHSLRPGCTAAWDPDEGIAEGNAQHPERAHWSGRRQPNTITFLHGKIPAGY